MEFFRVRNLDKYQHYKDRRPPWIKLYNEILDDYEFTCLPDASKFHLIAILLLASCTDNKLPMDKEWLSRKISATEDVQLDNLFLAKFIEKWPKQPQGKQEVTDDASKMLADCKQDARERREEKRREDGQTSGLSFSDFWDVYPRKEKRKRAEITWNRLSKAKQQKALSHLSGQPYADREKQYIPHPTTYMNNERWDDESDNTTGGNDDYCL